VKSNENEIIIREGLQENDEVMLVPPDKADKLKMILLDKSILAKYKPKPGKTKPQKIDTSKKTPVGGPPPAIIKK